MFDKRTDCCVTFSMIIQTDCRALAGSTACIFIFIFLQFLGKLTKNHSKTQADGFCIVKLLCSAFGMMNFLTHLIDVTSLTD